LRLTPALLFSSLLFSSPDSHLNALFFFFFFRFSLFPFSANFFESNGARVPATDGVGPGQGYAPEPGGSSHKRERFSFASVCENRKNEIEKTKSKMEKKNKKNKKKVEVPFSL
jgi:hypothetical protein